MKMNRKKRHTTERGRRWLALFVVLCLIGATVPVETKAKEQSVQDGLCEHHTEHDTTCGYAEAVEGHACGHTHDAACGYQEAGECTHVHDEGCGEDGQDCVHEHDEDCGYREAQDCTHEHDDACGYAEAAEGSPCAYVCDICSGQNEEEQEQEQDVQALINALPDAEDITEENYDEVSDLLDAIDEAKARLTDEERAALDLTKYDAAAAKMAELMGEEGAGEPSVAADVITVTTNNRPSGGTLRNINLNAAMLRPTSSTWSSSDNLVYFGKYNGSEIAYRVLSAPSTQTNVNNCLLLDCNTILLYEKFDADGEKNSGQNYRPNEWNGSDLESWLNGSDFYQASGVFSKVEKAAIATTSLAGKTAYMLVDSGLVEYVDWNADNHVFLLSSAEVYNLYSKGARIKELNGSKASWYTRSAKGGGVDTYHVGIVLDTGSAQAYTGVTTGAGISPAFNLDLSKILFASSNNLDKQRDLITGAESTATEWKLTLLDSNKVVKVPDGQSVTRTDNTITVPYTYTDNNTTNPVSQISVMITDKAYTAPGAKVLYYVALKDVSGVTGTGTFNLPSDLLSKTWSTDYHVYIIAEDVNGSKETDYASTPVEITATDSTGGSSSGDAYSISLSIPDNSPDNQTTLYFSKYELGPKTVTVTNNGTEATGELAVTIKGTDAAVFSVTPASISNLAVGEEATLTVTPMTGQNTGKIYKAKLQVQSTVGNGIAKEIGLAYEVYPETPTITGTLTDATYTQNETAEPLTISASVSDGGTLSYQWYRDIGGGGITGDDPVTGATGTSFTPPTGTVGTERYYCDVTNTKNELHITKTSPYVTITVTAAGGSSTESGTGTGGSGEGSGSGTGSSTGSTSDNESSVIASGNTIQSDTGSYEIIEGANSSWSADNSWTSGDSSGCTFRGNGEFAKFTGVQVDGILLDRSWYTAREGSTVITLLPAYLNTLATGTHTIEMLWTDGFAKTSFTVNADTIGNADNAVSSENANGALPTDTDRKDDVPKTGDSTLFVWLLGLAVLSGTGLLLTGKKGRRLLKP